MYYLIVKDHILNATDEEFSFDDEWGFWMNCTLDVSCFSTNHGIEFVSLIKIRNINRTSISDLSQHLWASYLHLWKLRHSISDSACGFLSTGTKRGDRSLASEVSIVFLRVRYNVVGVRIVLSTLALIFAMLGALVGLYAFDVQGAALVAVWKQKSSERISPNRKKILLSHWNIRRGNNICSPPTVEFSRFEQVLF